MGKLTPELKARIDKLGTTNLSDAMDALGFVGATCGIRPMWEGCPKICGEAVTLKGVAAGFTKNSAHMGETAIMSAKEGDVIVCDNSGIMNINTFGGILATACKLKGLGGFVSDGVVRDLDEIIDLDFPVYARGTVVKTNRGQLIEFATNIIVSFGGLQVRPGDVVVGDRSGVVVIPQEKLEEVVDRAEQVLAKEEFMIGKLKEGYSIAEVNKMVNYENMLK